jgi:hypothetical protein
MASIKMRGQRPSPGEFLQRRDLAHRDRSEQRSDFGLTPAFDKAAAGGGRLLIEHERPAEKGGQNRKKTRPRHDARTTHT